MSRFIEILHTVTHVDIVRTSKCISQQWWRTTIQLHR